MNSNTWRILCIEDVCQHIFTYLNSYDLYKVACLSKQLYNVVHCFCEDECKQLSKQIQKLFDSQLILKDERDLSNKLQDGYKGHFLPLYAKCRRVLGLHRVSATVWSMTQVRNPSSVEYDKVLGRDILCDTFGWSLCLEHTFCKVNKGKYIATVHMKLNEISSFSSGHGGTLIRWICCDENKVECFRKTVHVPPGKWETITGYLEKADSGSTFTISNRTVIEQYERSNNEYERTGWFSLSLRELDLERCFDVKEKYVQVHVNVIMDFYSKVSLDYIELKPLLHSF